MKTYYILLFVALLTCIPSKAQVKRESRLQINDNPLVKIDSTGKPNETLPMLFSAFTQMTDFTGIVSGKLCLSSDTIQTADVLEVPFKIVYENNEWLFCRWSIHTSSRRAGKLSGTTQMFFKC